MKEDFSISEFIKANPLECDVCKFVYTLKIRYEDENRHTFYFSCDGINYECSVRTWNKPQINSDAHFAFRRFEKVFFYEMESKLFQLRRKYKIEKIKSKL